MGGESVFGRASALELELTTLCLVVVIAFTVVFEAVTKAAENHLKGTPYLEMLSKVYKEMMIMGFISFTTFMAVQAGGPGVTSSPMLPSFEFAHILIFFTALLFVLIALVTIKFSSQLKRAYEISANTSVDQLLSHYSLVRRSKRFHQLRWISGISRLRDLMEFKLIHLYFQKLYDLPADFNFASYMAECLDFHILRSIEVEPSTWLFLCIIAAINIGFVDAVGKICPTIYAGLDAKPAEEHSSEHSTENPGHLETAGNGTEHANSTAHTTSDYLEFTHTRMLSESTSAEKMGNSGLPFYIMCGWLLFFLALLLYFMARRAELRLLEKTGALKTYDYEEALINLESEIQNRQTQQQQDGLDNESLQKLRDKLNAINVQIEQERERKKALQHDHSFQHSKTGLKYAPFSHQRNQVGMQSFVYTKFAAKEMLSRTQARAGRLVSGTPQRSTGIHLIQLKSKSNEDCRSDSLDTPKKQGRTNPTQIFVSPKLAHESPILPVHKSVAQPSITVNSTPQHSSEISHHETLEMDSSDTVTLDVEDNCMRLASTAEGEEDAVSDLDISDCPTNPQKIPPSTSTARLLPDAAADRDVEAGISPLPIVSTHNNRRSLILPSFESCESIGSNDAYEHAPVFALSRFSKKKVSGWKKVRTSLSIIAQMRHNEDGTITVPTAAKRGRRTLTNSNASDDVIADRIALLTFEMEQCRKLLEMGQAPDEPVSDDVLHGGFYQNQALCKTVAHATKLRRRSSTSNAENFVLRRKSSTSSSRIPLMEEQRKGSEVVQKIPKAVSQSYVGNSKGKKDADRKWSVEPVAQKPEHTRPGRPPHILLPQSSSLESPRKGGGSVLKVPSLKMIVNKTQRLKKIQDALNSPSSSKNPPEKVEVNLQSDISDIHLCKSPKFFEKLCDVVLLLICVYGSLYLTNYCILASEVVTISPGLTHILIILPLIMIFPVMGKVVKISSLLNAIAEIRPGIIAKVVEETIDTQKNC